MKKSFVALTIFLLTVVYALAQPGTPDLSFGNNGYVINEPVKYNDIAMQSDGKIIAIGGSATVSENYDDREGFFAIARYTDK